MTKMFKISVSRQILADMASPPKKNNIQKKETTSYFKKNWANSPKIQNSSTVFKIFCRNIYYKQKNHPLPHQICFTKKTIYFKYYKLRKKFNSRRKTQEKIVPRTWQKYSSKKIGNRFILKAQIYKRCQKIEFKKMELYFFEARFTRNKIPKI